MPFSDYKVALVTGASAGMGEAIVERLCQEGIEVHAVARRHEQLAALADRTGCIPHAVDVGDLSALTALCQGLQVDILVNNAGVSESTPFMEYTEETFDKVMDLNIKGVFNATRAAAECMVARGEGVILSTSSMVSISGQPSGFAYPASKFAVNGLTVSLARELGPMGIRVNAVAPGITETDMMKAVPKEVIDPMIARIPLRRLGQPEDIANAFVFLASDEASYITGVVLSVDGMART